MPVRSVRLSDLSLRSLGKIEPPALASWDRLAPALRALDTAGFHSIEAWGDLTFDRCLRSMRESPWERLSRLARHITRTPLQMEIRGRCLLGTRPHGPDVVRAFVEQAAGCGVRAFLVYEPLNDRAGLEVVAEAVRSVGARLTLGLVLEGNTAEAASSDVKTAEFLASMQPAAICLKTAEAMTPRAVAQLVLRVVDAVSVPIEVNIDNAGGLGAAAVLASLHAGATGAYGTAAPAWLDPSSVSLSQLVPVLEETDSVLEVDSEALAVAGISIASAAHAGDTLSSIPSVLHDASVVDWRDLMHVPADVVWQVAERLRSLEVSRRLPEVIAEIGRVRREIGNPALVAPVAQIVATQAVLNVIYQKRWQVIPDEMKAYLRGRYGSPPTPPVAEITQLSCEEPASQDGLSEGEASLERLAAELGSLAQSSGDLLLHALAPAAASVFLEGRQAALDVEALFDPVESPDAVAALQDHWRDLGPEKVGELVGLVEASTVDELTIESQGTRISLRKASQHGQSAAPAASQASGSVEMATQGAVADQSQTTVVASMVGTFYRSPAPGVPPYVEVGSHVEKGDPLCVLEAMKLMNEQLSDVSGEISAVLVEDGAAVEYGQPLFAISLDSA